jgi:hypothetical protein
MLVSLVAAIAVGCTASDLLFGPIPSGTEALTDLDLGVAVVEPNEAVTAALGVQTVVRWADIATVDGTVVRITAQRQNATNEDVGDPIHLVGDGTVGSGRDALADGDNDFVTWDIAGVRVGDYVIIATIESPDGTTSTVVSRDADRGTTGVITVTTSLPIPTLTFTAPGAADETVTTGNTFDIQWTDNGSSNPDAVVTLGLDTDTDHESGNEYILSSGVPLSENADTGQFTFIFQDENGATVPDGTYTVYAIVDDGANLPVTAEATGQLLLNP